VQKDEIDFVFPVAGILRAQAMPVYGETQPAWFSDVIPGG